MRKLLWLLAVCLLPISPAEGRDIYVDNTTGDDSFTGQQPQNATDRSGPVRTIAKALRLAASGDRIVLGKTDQPYRESISLVGSRHSGYPQRPFSIQGNGAILDGSAPVPPQAWEHYRGAVFRFRPSQAGHQQLFINDRPALRVIASRRAGAPPKLKKFEWCFHGGYVYFCVQPTKLPEDYNLSCAHLQTGITLFHVEGVVIADLTVQGFQIDGISLSNTARRVYIVGVVCRGNGRSGITVGGASTVQIDASLVGNNGRAQLLTLPYSETVIRNSDLLSNTAPGWVDRGGRVFLGDRRITGGREEVTAGQEARQPK